MTVNVYVNKLSLILDDAHDTKVPPVDDDFVDNFFDMIEEEGSFKKWMKTQPTRAEQIVNDNGNGQKALKIIFEKGRAEAKKYIHGEDCEDSESE